MKKIEEIIVEFSLSKYYSQKSTDFREYVKPTENDKKEPYLESLSDEELRIFLPHIEWSKYYKEFIEDILSKRVLEKRNNKLDNLGI